MRNTADLGQKYKNVDKSVSIVDNGHLKLYKSHSYMP
jgi:hypothetical protein